MYICDYCGRNLKKKYDNCPACGGTEFKRVQNIGEVVIKEPPKDGYHLNLKNLKYEKNSHWGGTFVFIWILLFALSFVVSALHFGNAFEELDSTILTIGIIAFAIVCTFSMASMFFRSSRQILTTSKEKIKKAEYLSKNGMLIKNLKYTIKPASKEINGRKTFYKIQVIYEIEKGKTMNFESEPKYLTALGRDDGTVDLLVDPNDYSNYFVDFEIY